MALGGPRLRRVGRAVGIGGKRAGHARRRPETLLGRRRRAGEHRRAVIGADLASQKAVAVEHVVGDVIGVRPDAELRVIGKIRKGVGVAVVGAGRPGGQSRPASARLGRALVELLAAPRSGERGEVPAEPPVRGGMGLFVSPRLKSFDPFALEIR